MLRPSMQSFPSSSFTTPQLTCCAFFQVLARNENELLIRATAPRAIGSVNETHLVETYSLLSLHTACTPCGFSACALSQSKVMSKTPVRPKLPRSNGANDKQGGAWSGREEAQRNDGRQRYRRDENAATAQGLLGRFSQVAREMTGYKNKDM